MPGIFETMSYQPSSGSGLKKNADQKEMIEFFNSSAASVGGKGFVVAGVVSRLSLDDLLLSRDFNRIVQLTDRSAFISGGCVHDEIAFVKQLQYLLKMYAYEQGKPMPCNSIIRVSSNIFYQSMRKAPYYCDPLLIGLDDNDVGFSWTCDPAGSGSKKHFSASPYKREIIYPLLEKLMAEYDEEITLEQAVYVIETLFKSLSQNTQIVGDKLKIVTITPQGFTFSETQLTED